VIGIFSNLMDAKRWVHASPAFMQFDIAHPEASGKKECVRAIEESAAYVSRGHLEMIRELTATPIDEVVLAGGAANGTLWPQIVADVLGLPVRIPVVTESTSLGAAAYAALGVGMYGDIDEAVAAIVHFDRTVEPRSAEHDAYEQLYEQWRGVYARALEMFESGLVRPLWRAAGT
jgi:autoinducer 2 (AI-2) kinase